MVSAVTQGVLTYDTNMTRARVQPPRASAAAPMGCTRGKTRSMVVLAKLTDGACAPFYFA